MIELKTLETAFYNRGLKMMDYWLDEFGRRFRAEIDRISRPNLTRKFDDHLIKTASPTDKMKVCFILSQIPANHAHQMNSSQYYRNEGE